MRVDLHRINIPLDTGKQKCSFLEKYAMLLLRSKSVIPICTRLEGTLGCYKNSIISTYAKVSIITPHEGEIP